MGGELVILSDYRAEMQRRKQREHDRCAEFLHMAYGLLSSGMSDADVVQRVLAAGYTERQVRRFHFYLITNPAMRWAAKEQRHA